MEPECTFILDNAAERDLLLGHHVETAVELELSSLHALSLLLE